MDIKTLISGSDVRGVATENGKKPVNLTGETVFQIALRFANWLSEKTGKPLDQLIVAVGRDSRLSGPELLAQVTKALSFCGVQVYSCALASTPSLFMSTVLPGYEADGAIMITASHMPYFYNGLKFFTRAGGLEGQDIATFLAGSVPQKAPAQKGKIRERDLLKDYAAHLRSLIINGADDPKDRNTPLRGFHIVVDAGNGAGGFFKSQVLDLLGAETRGSQFLEPDGHFPNHIPNPEDKKAIEAIRLAVVANKADLGIIFDTDVDRAAVILPDGQALNKNALIALLAAITLEETPGATIVTDSVTSDGLTTFIEQLGGKHHRFKRGYRNVIGEMIRLNAAGETAPLAIETSGHAAFFKNYSLDDGAYLVAKILMKMAHLRREGQTLQALVAGLIQPAEAYETRIPITEADFLAYGEALLKALPAYASSISGWRVVPKNYEGVRISCDAASGDGWLLLRLSLHEPLLVLNAESARPGGIKRMRQLLDGFLKTEDDPQ